MAGEAAAKAEVEEARARLAEAMEQRYKVMEGERAASAG